MNQSDRPQTTCGEVRWMAQVAPTSPPHAVAHLTGGERDTQGYFCQPNSEYNLFPICPKAKIPEEDPTWAGVGRGISHGGVSRVPRRSA